MKRSHLVSQSRLSNKVPSDAADAVASRPVGRGAGVPPSFVPHSRSLPRPLGAAAPHHPYSVSTATSPYYTRSASLTTAPTADTDSAALPSTNSVHRSFDRSLSHSVHSMRHPGHDSLVYRDLGSADSAVSLRSVAAYNDSAPVFRSVATEPAWEEPITYANGNAGKNSAWLDQGKFHDRFSSYGDHPAHYSSFPGLNNAGFNPKDLGDLAPPSLGGGNIPAPASDLSMMPPSLSSASTSSMPAQFDLSPPALADSSVEFPEPVPVADFTTLPALKEICEPGTFVAPPPKPTWVEPQSNFELFAVPRDVALSIGSFLSEHKVVFAYVAKECMFKCESYKSGYQVIFNVALFNASDDESPIDDEGRVQCVIEFQRRRGDCIQFGSLYRAARDSLTQSASSVTVADTEALPEESAERDVAEEGGPDTDAADMCDISCAVLLADNIPAGSPLAPKEGAVPEADSKMLTALSEMINSTFFEEQYEATATVARLAVNENNCRRILNHEASVNGLIATLKGRDPRMQRSAATGVANLVSHPEHVPRGSLNVLVLALIALLLLSTSLEVVRESARALVSLADLHQHFEPGISESVNVVLAKLANTHDEVAIGYRNELVRKVPTMSF